MDLTSLILGYLRSAWFIIEVALIFGLLVVGHEFGHFIMAKLTGMRVDEFAIGFGKRLFSFKKGETTYSVNILPLGGYNKIYGIDYGEPEKKEETAGGEDRERRKKSKKRVQPQDYSLAPPDDPRAFVNRPLHQRFAVVICGSLANIIIAILVVFLVGVTIGFPAAELGEVIPGGPAARAGMLPGDIITHLDGARISTTEDLHRAIVFSNGRPLRLKGIRGEEKFETTVIPQPIRLVDSHFCRLGFVYLNDASVLYVLQGSPAERAGLKPGDIILSGDGIKFPFQKLEVENGSGILDLEVYRDYSTERIRIDYFDHEIIRDTYSPFGFFSNADMVVTALVPRGIAEDEGIEIGDKIIDFGQEHWTFRQANEDAWEVKPLRVVYERDGKRHTARLAPDRYFSMIQVYMDDASFPVLVSLPRDHQLWLAGLRPKDRLVSIEGTPVFNGISARLKFEKRAGEEVTIVAMRGDEEQIVSVRIPSIEERQELHKFFSGLQFNTRRFRADPFTSLAAGTRKCAEIVRLIFMTIGMLATGQASMDELTGPVGIATYTYQAATSGLDNLINVMVLLSINLGIFNLLPFPALDGGRLLFMIAELVLRRPVVSVKVENIIHIAGFLLLILFALFITYHDIARLLFSN